MATLEQIGFTLLTGSCVLIVSLTLFGIAVRHQNTVIAPRAEARPRHVIFRPSTAAATTAAAAAVVRHHTNHPNNNTNTNNQTTIITPTTSSQSRIQEWFRLAYDSTFGWISWTLELSYDTMLHGVPGTGTRQDGMTGSLLTVNLDGIVLLRFSAMCLRVCCLAAVLFVFFGIPIYISAQCYSDQDTTILTTNTTSSSTDNGSNNSSNIFAATTTATMETSSPTLSSSTCDSNSYNLTNYERITIYNVPTIYLQNPKNTIFTPNDGILWRLYSIVFCFWMVVTYLCRLLHTEYIEILAMRRVYFLEQDIWESRRQELKQTLLYEEIAQKKRQQLLQQEQQQQQQMHVHPTTTILPKINEQAPSPNNPPPQSKSPNAFLFDETKSATSHDNNNNNIDTTTLTHRLGLDRIRQWKDRVLERRDLSTGTPTHASSITVQAEAYLTDREPWIPHPEQRETVPNIAIYSILVGGLPSLPEQAADSFNPASTIQFSQRESIDWQLSLTTAFFDHCVPNQPGFSSSIAAVTIVPGANDLSVAWRKWYTAAAKLRRLRFIRKHIQIRRQYEIESQKTSSGDINKANHSSAVGPAKEDERLQYEYGDSVDYGYEDSININNIEEYEEDVFVPVHSNHEEITSYLAQPPPMPHKNWIGREKTPRGIYEENPQNQLYYQQVLGSALGVENDTHIYDALEFGPEQAAVYAREFAQSSAPCCPNGFNEGYIRRARIDDLIEMERVTAVQVHQANLELRQARFHALRTDETNATNLHDQQRGHVVPVTNHKVTNSIAGNYNGVSPHAINLTRERSGQPPTVQEEEEEEDSDNIIDMLPKDMAKQPMASRYDRRASANDDTNPKTAPTINDRLNASRLEGLTVVGGDLDLEAQLFRKANTHRSASLHHVTSSTNIIETSDDNQELHINTPSPINTGSTTLRKRNVPNSDHSSSAQWAQVETLITEAHKNTPTTVWHFPRFRWFVKSTKTKSKTLGTWAKKQSKVAVNSLARESSYAVVTFTSRQAAVAARSCLADGRGANRWLTLTELPIPPLADAAPFDFVTFRNCCRPVTLSINERQKNCRNYLSIIFMGFLFVFYTVPLTLASQLVDPEAVSRIFPDLNGAASQYGAVLSGLVTASIWSTFFALCPVIFRSVANFGSKSTSVASAEFKALQYFWWFMITTAFSGQLLATMGLKAFNEGLSIESELQLILRQIAGSIPTTVAVSWLNWIIFRCTITLPLNYLLQVNTFLFHYLGMPCCSRLTRGGGPGASVPYRIYIDSGVVLMCTLTLAPSSPIVALAGVAYFLFLQPLLRRNLIFMYRPRFDGGGFRWPFIFDMCISAVYLAILLLTVQMALKQAAGPAVAASLTVVPMYMFQQSTKRRFLRAFEDAGLLQTSLLDGWDTSAEYSMEKREEFRRFLVDAHKAAYVSESFNNLYRFERKVRKYITHSLFSSSHKYRFQFA